VEEVTALVQAQRDAAWGEVARRLAHEIKNPLTPIRLSAERLRHKYLSKMSPEDAGVLDRSTHTIVQQVEVMRDMVQAFSDYARTPDLDLRPMDINKLINEVLDLYRGNADECQFKIELASGLPNLKIDVGRMRQLLHNLIKNSLEAAAKGKDCVISISTRVVSEQNQDVLELRIKDNGPGISEKIMGHFFEPYVTTKPKGSGLGLAVVKKIIEEHGGSIWAENPEQGGAEIIIHLPLNISHPVKEWREDDEDILEVSDEYLETTGRIMQQDDKG
jgi:nitrogen fixation/metabolism regulation signal transduction histidine kinase